MSRNESFNDQADDLRKVRQKLTGILSSVSLTGTAGTDIANLAQALAKIAEVEQEAIKLGNPRTITAS